MYLEQSFTHQRGKWLPMPWIYGGQSTGLTRDESGVK